MASPYIEAFAGSSTAGQRFVGAAVAAVVGGTISEATGGKFANGATTAAFGYLFNQVSGTFNRKTGQLSVVDLETGESVSGQFFSGGGWFGDPIAPGDYAILQRGSKDGFRLEALDSNFGDDKNPQGQKLLRLHGPGNSVGCITACPGTNWVAVRDFISSTKTSTVTVSKYSGWSFGGFQPFRVYKGAERVNYYGTIKVQ
jgi:hypothetical protein